MTYQPPTPTDPNEGIDECRLDHAAEAERDVADNLDLDQHDRSTQ